MRKNRLDVDILRSFKRKNGVKFIGYDDAVEDFYSDRIRTGTRESTIEYYRRELNIFRRFKVKECDQIIGISEISLELLDSFIEYLRVERGNSIGGINAKVRAIRALMFYCEESGFIKENPAKKWKQIKTKEPEINTFTSRQINELLKQPDLTTFTGLRDYILIKFLLGNATGQ
ncbi:tyrosine-type recombinase/integrase [Alkalihalobacillus trypoxylicola]|uniref:Core-binding (CB) domain-containing protein n=1 Tax=Alkalihalobacillus trypoxylicola TaxID=519424 RepID=A0A162FCS7_9BACI|nr:phage integrase SAM-like domain-containing protein [Alkalihalobacillus trypoxylicola]KYG35310.1 hypothetical protein AZF04_02950 [Alkalihalobacillus trypoxylicola]